MTSPRAGTRKHTRHAYEYKVPHAISQFMHVNDTRSLYVNDTRRRNYFFRVCNDCTYNIYIYKAGKVSSKLIVSNIDGKFLFTNDFCG